jgi:pimeloyl-ACP methyl ester carboxylesterase
MTRPHPAPQGQLDRPPWLPTTEWPFTIRYFDLGGDAVHYVDEGAGPTLLFVHAGMWSFVWRDVIVALASSFRCVTLDFPGSGLSPAIDGRKASLYANTGILASFVRGLGLSDLTLVLHDLGGPIGLAYAAQEPHMVRRLVVTQSFGWPVNQRALHGMLRLMGGPTVRALNVATTAIPALTSTRFGVGRNLSGPGRRAFRGPTGDRRQRHAFHDLMGDAARAGGFLARIESGLRDRLADRPVLTIFGERNDPFDFQGRWRELFPDSRQVVVPSGNHFPMNDDPGLFAASLRSWHLGT